MVVRAEYPRPRFVRERWKSLNGEWRFAFDPDGSGPSFDRAIIVPFAAEWPLSGIGDRGCHVVAWYRRTFDVPDDWRDDTVWLRFGAVDHACQVWVNDRLVGTHEGGHTPFGFDVTEVLRTDGNTVVVRVHDNWKDLTVPRGKQCWSEHPTDIFYTRTTGIWQSVWLEPVPRSHLIDVRVSSAGTRVRMSFEVSSAGDVDVTVAGRTATASGRAPAVEIDVGDAARWSPAEPNLHDVEIRFGSDVVKTYVGMRDLTWDRSGLHIDNVRVVQRLVLDQGYWPDGGLTAPTDDALCADASWVKQLGFDGVRKHQKIEDPRWLYHCDRLGVLVWSEQPNAYAFTDESCRLLIAGWQEAVRRDRSHPCVVCWVPINESWGVPEIATDARQASFASSLYHLTHALDGTRPVVDNDGWEHTEDTDLLTIHDYAPIPDALRRSWVDGLPVGTHRPPLVDGARYRDQPVLVTEYGGVKFIPTSDAEPDAAWGYGEAAPTAGAFVDRYRDLTSALADEPRYAGWCYTQLTDVEQETNGLLTFDRRPKVDPSLIAAINRR